MRGSILKIIRNRNPRPEQVCLSLRRCASRLAWTAESTSAREWTSRVVDRRLNESSESSNGTDNIMASEKEEDSAPWQQYYHHHDSDDESDASGRLPVQHLGVLHPQPDKDIQLLMQNYTLPALASALREREDLLQEAASLAADRNTQALYDLLHIFHPNFVLERRERRRRVDVTQSLEPNNSAGLEQIRKTLARLPRTVVTAHHKRAGVVLPLCTIHGVPSILLEQRSFEETIKYPGQVCFPGGMACPLNDDSIVATCLREMNEEIGGLVEQPQVLGIFRTHWHPIQHLVGGVAVTPVVCFVGELGGASLKPCPKEVAEVFTIPLADLTRDFRTKEGTGEPAIDAEDYASSDSAYWDYEEGRAPIFRGGPHVIWGLTGFILDKFTQHVLVPNSNTVKYKK